MKRSILLPESIADAVEWLVEQIERHPYSEVGILFSCHGGEIRRIDKSVSQKEKITTSAAKMEPKRSVSLPSQEVL